MQAYYGRVVLNIGDTEAFAPYESFVHNYAASLALLLENRRQQSELEQALLEHTRLERELRAQREELLTQNERLEAARAEAARLFEKQRVMFVRLQEALLDVPQQMPGVRFGHVYRSATEEAGIGGDFYDVFEAKDGVVGIVIGDVCGHGLEAARLATLVKDTVHAFAHQFSAPHHVLRETNRLLLEKKIAGFVTAFLGLLDPDTGILVYSSAGHPPPLFAEDGNVTLLESQSTPLGVFFDARYTDGTVAMKPGQTVILYTDGITEARRGDEFFGDDGLIEAVHALTAWPTEKLPSLLLERALAFSGGYLRDDLALLAVSYTGRPTDVRLHTPDPS
jgi:serine phosphatase RsbU (regulator of sigma subunit)